MNNILFGEYLQNLNFKRDFSFLLWPASSLIDPCEKKGTECRAETSGRHNGNLYLLEDLSLQWVGAVPWDLMWCPPHPPRGWKQTGTELILAVKNILRFTPLFLTGNHECLQTSTSSIQMRYERNSKHACRGLKNSHTQWCLRLSGNSMVLQIRQDTGH